MRTFENENDVSKKYFRDPTLLLQQQKMVILQQTMSDMDEVDGNILIQKLRQQSIDNREKNDLYVARKTFEADQVRSSISLLLLFIISSTAQRCTIPYIYIIFFIGCFCHTI
jgi:hypothetical protein